MNLLVYFHYYQEIKGVMKMRTNYWCIIREMLTKFTVVDATSVLLVSSQQPPFLSLPTVLNCNIFLFLA